MNIQQIVFYLIIVYALLNLYISLFNPYAIMNKLGAYATLLSVAGGFILLFIYNAIGSSFINELFALMIFLLIFGFLYLLIFYIYFFLVHYGFPKTIFNTFTNGLLIIGALAIIYTLFLNVLENDKMHLYQTFLYKFIFYIPCIYIDLVQYIKVQFAIQSSVVKLLLLLQFLFLLIRVIIPIILTKSINYGGLTLLDKPVYLNESNTIINVKELNKKFQKEKIYDYSLSFWLTIDSQPPNTSEEYIKYTTLINFGKKPLIEYNGIEDKLRIKMLNGRTTDLVFKTNKILYQKWNHFVINYKDGILDIFINNKLVSTNKNVLPYLKSDSIELGKANGIHGGICNFKYFDKSLSTVKIDAIYKYYKNNPCKIY